MGTTSFLNIFGDLGINFSPTGVGSASSTGVAYDLISEGEIELVNGLSGVYFNRTPIVNESLSSNVQANQLGVFLNGTGPFTVEIQATLPAGLQLPVIVLDGLAEGTVSSSTSTTVTASSFFTTAMINGSSGDGTLVPKLRIKSANLDGSDYVGSITSIASNTATVSPPIPTNAAGKRINFDLFTTATATPLFIEGTDTNFSTLQITSIPNSVNIKARNDARILVDSVSGNLPGSTSDDKNFKYVSVNFRPGTLSQLPVKNLPSFTAASLGFAVNQEIKQFTNYFNNSKLNNFWGKYTLKRPSGAIGGAEVVINASSVAPGSITEVDELLLTISAPNGLYAANSEGKPRQWGAVFQIIFRYTNGSVTKDVIVFGPTDAEVTGASILVAADSGTFRRNGADPTGTIRAASKTALDFDFRWSLEQYKPFTDFQVIVRKVTTDNLEYNNDIIVATTSIKALQAFINDKLSYPHSAYAAIAFDSLEFAGNFPERAYRCRGVRTELPKNYVTREEASDGIAKYTRNNLGVITSNYQIWDGTFRRGYSNNPIWNLREMLLNKRWGLGHWIDPSLINNYSFYSLARYCDELVPDGKGGLEPRFTCGVYLTEPVEAYKIIRDFCTMVLSIPYWVDGQMIIEADRPAEPVYTFTKGNIEGGIFSYEGTGNKTRPNQIAVRFNNKDNFYEQDLELVDDVEDMVKQNRIFTEEVIAFGATTRGQAIRYGKWKLLTSKLQKEVISFKTGENGAYLKPGSIVNIQDADRNSVRYSGRLVSATTSSVVLDSAVSLPSGNEYTLHVFIPGAAVYLVQDSVTLAEGTFTRGALLPATIGGVLVDTEEEASKIVDTGGNPVDVQFVDDAHIESKVISGIPVSGTTLNVIGNFTTAPGAETVWAITVKNNGALVEGSAKQYKILSIGEESPGLYNITAAEHFNSKFDLIDEEFLATSPRTVPRYVEVPSIIDFSAKIVTTRQTNDDLSNAQQTLGVELNWVGPGVYTNNVLGLYPDFDFYMLEIKDPQNNITTQNFPKSATMHTINNAIEGRYEFTLRAKSTLGPSSPPSRVNITVSSPSSKSSNLVATLPRGGTFSKPINVGASSITTPSSYRFTAESGVSVVYSDTAPRVTSGTYWSNGTGVFLWDGTNWIVISGTFPNGLFSTLDSFTLSAVGSVGGALTGSLSSTLGNVTVAGTGSFTAAGISGSLSSTLGNVTVAGTGSFTAAGISGSLSSTLGDVTVAGTGSVPFIGSLSSTLGDVTVAGTGSFTASGISGSLSSTLGDVTVAGTGSFTAAGISGSLSSTLGNVTVAGTGSVTSGAWTPLQLFQASERGFWIDPNDLSTLFQDAAGTVPVTTVGQPVGRILDKSGNGNHWTIDSAGRRPTLQQDGNVYYLNFDGSDDYMTNSGLLNLFRNTGAGYMGTSIKLNTIPGDVRTVFTSFTGIAETFRYGHRLDVGKYVLAARRLDNDTSQNLLSTTNLNTSRMSLLSRINWAGTQATMFINGVVDAQNNSFLTAGNTSDTNSFRNLTLGARQTGGSFVDYPDMRIYGAIAGNSNISDTDVTNLHNYWNPPSTFMTVSASVSPTQDGNYDVYTFNSSGTFQVTALGTDPTEGNKAEYLVIAGGGGGGNRRGGGGGAGGYRTNRSGDASGGGASAESAMTLTAQSYSVVVGAGGGGGGFGTENNNDITGTVGANSSVFGIVSNGGGGGGRSGSLAGGSGGGAADGFMGPSTATANQGFPGWVDDDTSWNGGGFFTAGGGGGAGEAGLGGERAEGLRNGGNGVASTITGTSITRGGGGGGGLSTNQTSTPYTGTLTPGGAGGGGSGGAVWDMVVRGGTGTPGTVNTGGGGGGGGQHGGADNLRIGQGANGGSGVVIVRVRAR